MSALKLVSSSTITCPRIHFGRCSFIAPTGFTLQQQASVTNDYTNTDGETDKSKPSSFDAKSPLTITLSNCKIPSVTPICSNKATDMKPEAYPASICLTTLPISVINTPLAYLQQSNEALKFANINYQLDFCREELFKAQPAACSQSWLQTNFKIFQLSLSWLNNDELIITTLSVSESGVEKGWMNLRSFADSVVL